MIRFYSIQSKLFLVSLLSITIIIGGGCLSFYLSTQMLSATSLFVNTTLPRIETAKALEKTALDIMNAARDLPQSSRKQELNETYHLLITMLDRLEKLTATISQEEPETDILALNWTSQAIRSQAQLVLQMEAKQLDLAQQGQIMMQQVRIQLANLPTLEPDRQSPHLDLERHNLTHAYIVKLLSQVNQLELARTPEEVDALESSYQTDRKAFFERIRVHEGNSPAPKGDAGLGEIQTLLKQLFVLQRRNLQIRNNISRFIEDLNAQVLQLTELTTEHINHVFNHFHQSARQVIKREKQTLYLTLLLMTFSIMLLILLHKRIVVHGFGDRLSSISQAMASEPGERRSRNLPLQGRDEIADMARALDVLLDKAIQLRDLAIMDELTQVYNRRRFFELAGKEASRVSRKKAPTILLMIDLDHFKALNDTYGHTFGDKVLHGTAQICLRTIRNEDIFARCGGEEFAALMPETDLREGMVVAERIRRTIESTPFVTDDGHEVNITLSLGLTETDLSRITVDQALQHADIALYQAKAQGRNRVVAWKGAEA